MKLYAVGRIVLINAIILLTVSGCGSGLQWRPQEQKPFVITDPNVAIAFERIDAVAESIKPITEHIEKIINTPVIDAVIPKPVKQGLYFAGANLIAFAGWYLNSRKNLFKNGFNELAEADELFLAETITGNKDFDTAAKQIIKAPTRRLLKRQGFENLLSTKVNYGNA